MIKKQTKKRSSVKKINRSAKSEVEPDSRFILKLVLVVLLASVWLKFSSPFTWMGVLFTAIPLGLFVGLVVIHLFEHFQTDRKIWYAVLVVVGILSYFVPAGIII